MAIPAAFVHEALLGHNYLPAQRRRKEELPPIFSSETFTPVAAAPLLSMKPKEKARGFDLVEYRATKFNSVARSYAIPHPIAYAQLSNCIASNWSAIEPFQTSHVSMIRPRQHKDKRIIIMDYENFAARASRVRRLAFNKRYVAKADIATCFPSVYTHAFLGRLSERRQPNSRRRVDGTTISTSMREDASGTRRKEFQLARELRTSSPRFFSP